jgi:arsenate reductase-like glutaredoxin family protein
MLYGITNCDTVKKARTWLAERGIAYAFHDYKATGADADKLAVWCAAFGWETVLNRAGTTFRKLPDAEKAGLDQARAVVEHPGGLLIGFKPAEWEVAFGR